MKTNKIILIPVFLTSCVYIHGDKNKETYTLAMLGGDATALQQTSFGYSVKKLETSEAFAEGAKTVRTHIVAGAIKSVASTGSRAWTNVTKSKEATSRVGLAEKGLTDRAGISAGVEKARIAATPTGF
jgi:hypothetical protein